MSEKVLGFRKQKMNCHYCGELREPKVLSGLCKDCAEIPIYKKDKEVKLVPVVSVEWLKKWCKENKQIYPDYYDEAQEYFVVHILDLLSAVEKEAGKK